MIATLALVALSAALPTVEPATICKSAQVSVSQADAKAAFDGCLRDEQKARDKIKAGWAHYSAAARSACREDNSGVPTSYVELWTCLEMQPGGSLSLNAASSGGPAQKLSPGAPPPAGSAAPTGVARRNPSAPGSTPGAVAPASPPPASPPPGPGAGAPAAGPAVAPGAGPLGGGVGAPAGAGSRASPPPTSP